MGKWLHRAAAVEKRWTHLLTRESEWSPALRLTRNTYCVWCKTEEDEFRRCQSTGRLYRLLLVQREMGLSWAWLWSGFIIFSVWINQPGDGTLCAIFSVAALPKAKCFSIVLPGLSWTHFCFDCGGWKPRDGHKYQSAKTINSSSSKWVDLLSDGPKTNSLPRRSQCTSSFCAIFKYEHRTVHLFLSTPFIYRSIKCFLWLIVYHSSTTKL